MRALAVIERFDFRVAPGFTGEIGFLGEADGALNVVVFDGLFGMAVASKGHEEGVSFKVLVQNIVACSSIFVKGWVERK